VSDAHRAGGHLTDVPQPDFKPVSALVPPDGAQCSQNGVGAGGSVPGSVAHSVALQ
jgi:hypothetical protein